MNNDLIELGYCTRPHGIRGQFSFILHNLEESVLCNGFEITLIPSGAKSKISKDGEVYKISKISIANKVIASLENVNDRNKVEEMLPFKIMVSREQLPEEEDEVYLTDLPGCLVYEHSTGNEIGRCTDIYFNGAQDVLVFIDKENKVIELPLIDQFFPLIDIENKRIEAVLPEYI